MQPNKLITICGPTCSGKTSLAIKLCKKFDGEIVSADSRQVYKYMDIGTGKLPLKYQSTESRITDNEAANVQTNGCKIKGITVHGYDLVKPDQSFSAGDFKEYAQTKFREIWEKGRTPLLAGGTGFYIAAALGEVELSGVKANHKLRKRLAKLTKKELFEKLKELDPERAKEIDHNNPQRLIRAIEIANYETGKHKSPSALNSLTPLKIGLKAPRKVLYQGADRWAEKVVGHGLIKEVKELIEMGYKNTKPLQGIIYATVLEYLEGKKTKQEMLQRIKWDLHKYIRRQLTWFKRDQKINWLDISKPSFDIKANTLVESYLKR
jgi:tRNA dimethylallyltransferase